MKLRCTAWALLLSAGLECAPSDRARDPWFAEDKLKHFFTSFVVTSISASGARAVGLDRRQSIRVGAAVAGTSGLLKEVDDARRGGVFSVADLVWDAGGVGAGVLMLERSR
jgi:uncharacterized protein YfiM (DUF2279 family)